MERCCLRVLLTMKKYQYCADFTGVSFDTGWKEKNYYKIFLVSNSVTNPLAFVVIKLRLNLKLK